VPPPEGPFKAIVAEAVTAALAQAMPRIIVAALTRTPMAKISIGLLMPGGPIFTPANRGPSRVRNGKGLPTFANPVMNGGVAPNPDARRGRLPAPTPTHSGPSM